MQFKDRVYLARKSMKPRMSQPQLAKACGIGLSTLLNIENGRSVRKDKLDAVKKFLGLRGKAPIANQGRKGVRKKPNMFKAGRAKSRIKEIPEEPIPTTAQQLAADVVMILAHEVKGLAAEIRTLNTLLTVPEVPKTPTAEEESEASTRLNGGVSGNHFENVIAAHPNIQY